MNLRTKTIGLVAALALSMTLTGGITSAQSTTSTTLTAPDAGVGVCTLAVADGQNVSFGTYQWNGSSYDYLSGAKSGVINADLTHTGSPGKRHCNAIQVTGSNLTDGGANIAFLANKITVGTAVGLDPTTPKDATVDHEIPLSTTVPVSLDVTVTGVPQSTAPIGDYFGIITLTLASGS